ncbi:hypothetical protein [Maribacter sp. 2210JD10-5]|uniref:hypothetical protein n=1 Tax=Maribacter sp. 2210JD10-5 TaxID=3386272 RepID=UPI0039BC9AD6
MKILVTLLLFLIMAVQPVAACKCLTTDFKTAYEQTEIITKGIVTNIGYKTYDELLTAQEFDKLTQYFKAEGMNLRVLNEKVFIQIELEISCTYKGTISSNKIKVYTSSFHGMCSYSNFELGKEFIVYLSRGPLTEHSDIAKTVYTTNRCMRTRPFEKEEDLLLCNAMYQ